MAASATTEGNDAVGATAAETAHQYAVMRDEETQVNDQSPADSPPHTKDGGEDVEQARVEAAGVVNAEPERGTKKDQDETTKFVEWDPSGRFGRTTELLGRGTYKNVYKAFDEEEGMDVAWNQVKVNGLPAAEKQRLISEVEILKRLDHKNVLKFYHSWNTTSEKTGEVSVNFITEACAGTLNKYAARFKNNLDMRAVKSWARQILRGLEYLHSHDPPIVHRDLKCDNIFVNGNAGEIKIGDLGLAAMLDHQRTHSVIGTPEFMAPELYEEDYDERVDIYSFGMCLIELVTFECPYNECKNPAQIYKRVSSGIPPAALEKIKDKGDKIYEFITLAIAPHDQRPTATQLLEHPWLQKEQCKKSMVPRSIVEEEPEAPRPHHADHDDEPTSPEHIENGRKIVRVYSEADTLEPPTHRRGSSLDVRVKGLILEDDSLRLRLRIADANGHNRTVEFPFNTETDSAHSVAAEMVEELGLETTAIITIEREIEKEVKYLWEEKRGHNNAENSGASSPEANLGESVNSMKSLLTVASQLQLNRAASNESLSEGIKPDASSAPSAGPFIDNNKRERMLTRSQSAFGAVKQEGPPAASTTLTSGTLTPGDATPPLIFQPIPIAPARPSSVPPPATLQHVPMSPLVAMDPTEPGKPPRAPIANPQPSYSEALMHDLQRIVDDGSAQETVLSATSSDAGSFVNEEEHEELEELRLLEELEMQQQQEEAEMRQRHTTERQQKLRSLQKKRLERTASKMALFQIGADSESNRPATSPLLKPATRLATTVNATTNPNSGLPPQPPVAPQLAPAMSTNTASTQQQEVDQLMPQISAEFNSVPISAQVTLLQADDATMSRTNSLKSMASGGNEIKLGEDGSDLHLEEQQRVAKERKRIEAIAKMQMMEQTSLLSLDSKPKEKKGSMGSMKADSADEG